mgnify:CR=1 FL=1
MKNFKIADLWQHRQRAHAPKHKAERTPQKRVKLNDGWDMSPEDALRVSYSGHK